MEYLWRTVPNRKEVPNWGYYIICEMNELLKDFKASNPEVLNNPAFALLAYKQLHESEQFFIAALYYQYN